MDHRWEGRWVRYVPGDVGQKGHESPEMLDWLHSDGWVYTRRDCRFELPDPDKVWERVDGRWIVTFGVSTMQDYLRNFVVDVLNTTLTGRVDEVRGTGATRKVTLHMCFECLPRTSDVPNVCRCLAPPRSARLSSSATGSTLGIQGVGRTSSSSG